MPNATKSKPKAEENLAQNIPSGVLMYLALGDILPSASNPRKRFEDAALNDLADSIRAHGIIEPLVVRPGSNGSAGKYLIIAGERRWRAAQLAGVAIVPCAIRLASAAEAIALALVENLQRQDIAPIEEAHGYKALTEMGYTQTQIAEKVHRSQGAIGNTLRLLNLPEDVQKQIISGQLTYSHGLAILEQAGALPALASTLGKIAIDHKLPSRSLEKDMPSAAIASLLKSGNAQEINYQTPWDYNTVCRTNCPFKAFRNLGYTQVCLNPTHYDELITEAEAK